MAWGGAADPELLAAYPRMPATVIAERIGWQNSIRVLLGEGAKQGLSWPSPVAEATSGEAPAPDGAR